MQIGGGCYKAGLKNFFFFVHYGHFTEPGYGHVGQAALVLQDSSFYYDGLELQVFHRYV